MATDPIQALIDAGAIPTSPFGPSSRYQGVAFGASIRDPAEPPIPYLLRRFPPAPESLPTAFLHVVQAGERPDLLAARAYGDPELQWRIADANAVTDPFELTDTLGRRVRIPSPEGS